ncbi:hypothetical protein BB559_007279 [Furculomyces boomerangus]|uniref:Myb/SANT-like DNA-binding domain-containing protein n=1 Tax=Furculomyces boomerangus TaxID=61424 RepID=A0A2T9XY32_9FUNG|nr:hypothetical protein BB559_007279 [Furculomyces boomerangus]
MNSHRDTTNMDKKDELADKNLDPEEKSNPSFEQTHYYQDDDSIYNSNNRIKLNQPHQVDIGVDQVLASYTNNFNIQSLAQNEDLPIGDNNLKQSIYPKSHGSTPLDLESGKENIIRTFHNAVEVLQDGQNHALGLAYTHHQQTHNSENPSQSQHRISLTELSKQSILAPKFNRSKNWGKEETSTLLKILVDLTKDLPFVRREIVLRSNPIFDQVALRLKEKGYDRNTQACLIRWRNLIRIYKTQQRISMEGNSDIKELQYANEIRQIYANNDPNLSPDAKNDSSPSEGVNRHKSPLDTPSSKDYHKSINTPVNTINAQTGISGENISVSENPTHLKDQSTLSTPSQKQITHNLHDDLEKSEPNKTYSSGASVNSSKNKNLLKSQTKSQAPTLMPRSTPIYSSIPPPGFDHTLANMAVSNGSALLLPKLGMYPDQAKLYRIGTTQFTSSNHGSASNTQTTNNKHLPLIKPMPNGVSGGEFPINQSQSDQNLNGDVTGTPNLASGGHQSGYFDGSKWTPITPVPNSIIPSSFPMQYGAHGFIQGQLPVPMSMQVPIHVQLPLTGNSTVTTGHNGFPLMHGSLGKKRKRDKNSKNKGKKSQKGDYNILKDGVVNNDGEHNRDSENETGAEEEGAMDHEDVDNEDAENGNESMESEDEEDGMEASIMYEAMNGRGDQLIHGFTNKNVYLQDGNTINQNNTIARIELQVSKIANTLAEQTELTMKLTNEIESIKKSVEDHQNEINKLCKELEGKDRKRDDLQIQLMATVQALSSVIANKPELN